MRSAAILPSMISSKLAPFGTSVFGEMTRLAQEHGAINLSQGFPDFEGPSQILEFAARALHDGHNQYARPLGMPQLVTAIADNLASDYGLEYDAMSEVCVTSGATEAIAASLLGILESGDEVLAFEPFYDSYPACSAIAGAQLRTVPLRFPNFDLDVDALRAAITPRTRVLMLNSPHNPTGKVFARHELEAIAELCLRHDLIAICDEVYEHLFYDDHEHIPLAAIDGMRERTIGISSTGKTFSLTGWKIGWAYGAQPLIAAVFAAHQFLTFATATPLQIAMAEALREFRTGYFESFRAEYDVRRQKLLGILRGAGFDPAEPEGSYFVLAAYGGLYDGDDVAFAKHLTSQYGVAAIPPSSFYDANADEGRRLLRFAFCKRLETLEAAGERLAGLTPEIPEK